MTKKSITPSLRLNEEDYLKLKELKKEYDVSWTKFIAYVNALVEKDMKDTEEKNNGKSSRNLEISPRVQSQELR